MSSRLEMTRKCQLCSKKLDKTDFRICCNCNTEWDKYRGRVNSESTAKPKQSKKKGQMEFG
jgi:hypothetical protein